MFVKIFKSPKAVPASLIAASVLSGAFGFTLGRTSAPNDHDVSIHTMASDFAASRLREGKSLSANSVADRAASQSSSDELARQPRKGFERVMNDFGRSPLSSIDFEAMFQIWEAAENLGVHEIENFLRTLDEGNGGQEAMMAKALLANQFGSHGGAVALDYFLSLDDPHARNEGFTRAMVGWMREDPEAAYSWLQNHQDSLDSGIDDAEVTAMYFSLKAEENYSEVLGKSLHLEDSSQEAVIKVLAERAATNTEQRDLLLDTLRREGDARLTRHAENAMVDQLAWQDPAKAMDVIAELEISDARRAELEEDSLNIWSSSDPSAAIRWQQKRLAGQEGAGDEIADSFRNWVGKDETAAGNWLRKQGEEFKTDLVFQKAVQVLRDQSPARAAEWQAQVFNDAARQEGYRKIYNRWERQDARAAEEWKNSLPAADRAAFASGEEASSL